MHDEVYEDGVLTGASARVDPDAAAVEAVRAVAEPGGGETPPPDAADAGAPPPAGENGGGEYDFEWPEGYAADPAAMARFVPLARKLGLSGENARELAHLYVELDAEKRRSQAEFIARNNADWLKEIHSHPEFGGRNLEHTSENVAAMMRRFGTPLLLGQVRQMNIQNWPEMFFFLARVSRAVTEDCSPSGGGAEPAARSTAQLLFPGLK